MWPPRWVQAHRSETCVVILSDYDEIEYVHAAIESMTVDFLVKHNITSRPDRRAAAGMK